MRVGRLLGFIVSKEGIRINPLNVEAIFQLSTLRNIRHIHILKGMANFLQRFMVNFSNFTKGFMCLLKKAMPYIWDEWAQESFDALNKALASAPVLSPPDYRFYFVMSPFLEILSKYQFFNYFTMYLNSSSYNSRYMDLIDPNFLQLLSKLVSKVRRGDGKY